MWCYLIFFLKQKTAYEMRISDWSSDVCSSYLGVSAIRDEANREGVRVVSELKRDATPEVVLNQVYRYTPAQSNFPANVLALRGGRPEVLSLKDIIESFVKFREEVITRRSKFELLKARERAHILLGLVIAVTNLDEVVRIIRGSRDRKSTRLNSS